MGNFLKLASNKQEAKPYNIDLVINVTDANASKVKTALETIVSMLNENDIILLGKLANDTIMRPIALKKLREYFS